MSAPFQPVTAEEVAAILRLHDVEQWPVGTIASHLGRHHDTVERVLTHGGLPVTKQTVRSRLVDPFLPFIQDTLAKSPRLEEKTRRSLAHRQHLAGIGPFKPVSSYDWNWPRKVDRALIDELFTRGFIAEGANVVFLGPNGVSKTMLLRNLADRSLLRREARRPPLRGRHAEIREISLDPPHHEQALRRVAHDLPERGMRRDTRGPADAQVGDRHDRRRQLPAPRSRRASARAGRREEAEKEVPASS